MCKYLIAGGLDVDHVGKVKLLDHCFSMYEDES